MKILGLTDLHASDKIPIQDLKRLVNKEQIDLILIAGDLTTFGTSKDVRKILEQFNQLNKPIFYIPGNMDAVDSSEHEFSNIFPLHTRVKEFGGYNFLGLGASNPTPFHTPFTLSEDELENLLKKAKNTIKNNYPLILMTHAPPLDSEADIIHNGKHVGSLAVKKFIQKEKPILVFTGHIHESKSISNISETICINSGPARYRNAVIITIDENPSSNKKNNIQGKLITF